MYEGSGGVARLDTREVEAELASVRPCEEAGWEPVHHPVHTRMAQSSINSYSRRKDRHENTAHEDGHHGQADAAGGSRWPEGGQEARGGLAQSRLLIDRAPHPRTLR